MPNLADHTAFWEIDSIVTYIVNVMYRLCFLLISLVWLDSELDLRQAMLDRLVLVHQHFVLETAHSILFLHEYAVSQMICSMSCVIQSIIISIYLPLLSTMELVQ